MICASNSSVKLRVPSCKTERTAVLNFYNLIFFRTAMLPDDLDTVQIDVAPGLALPAGAANFVFNRLRWISEGETGPFENDAPSGWDFNDLCTLSFLLSNQELSLAQSMVENLQQLPSILQPSATLTVGNNNHLKKRPFRGRLRQQCGKQKRQKQEAEENCSAVGKVGASDRDTKVDFKS